MPFWARDASGLGIDRSLDLPCFGAKLKGDYEPPFTCGSDTRRSIIKYFVRDEINANSTGNTITEGLVCKMIVRLKEAWKDVSVYPCKCKSQQEIALYGANSLLCCKTLDASSGEKCTCLDGETSSTACCENGNNFLPESVQVWFDEITADEVVGAIIEKIPGYVKRIMTEKGNVAFKKYNDQAKVAQWNWIDQGMGESAVKESGLFSSVDPIMYYNASEAGFPFRKDVTMWEMCAGMVSQVCFFVVIFIQFNPSIGWTRCTHRTK